MEKPSTPTPQISMQEIVRLMEERIAIKEVAALLEMRTEIAVYSLMKRDPSFPRPAKISSKSRWVRGDVTNWIALRLHHVSQANAKRLEDASDAR